jgi:hypothetical protein
VRTQVQAAVKANSSISLEEVRQVVILDDWNKRLAGDNKYRQRAFREYFVEPGVECAYKEAKGEPITE